MGWAILSDPKVGAQRAAPGIWVGIPPKIGLFGLIIDIRHVTGDWQMSPTVAKYVASLTNDEMGVWFQIIESGNWRSAYGLVNHTGRITQWG